MLRLIVVLALLLATPAMAKGQPQPITVESTGSFDWYISPLDTQGCGPGGDPACQVFNNTHCGVLGLRAAWNDQDVIQHMASGYIDGAWSDTLCLIADYDGSYGPAWELYPHGVYVNVYAPGDTLGVSLVNDAGAVWTAGPSIASGNQRLWRLCVTDTVADGRPLSEWPEVPDSNGGRGQRVAYTLVVTSPNRRTRDVVARFQIATRYHDPPVNGERHPNVVCP